MENTVDLYNPFIRIGHDSPPVELSIENLLSELLSAFACYIAWEHQGKEFDESKAQRAYRKIKEIVSNAKANEGG